MHKRFKVDLMYRDVYAFTVFRFVCNRLATKVFIGNFPGYGMNVGDHKVA